MDLWIRSQTKIGLIKTNDICIRSVLHKKDINDKGKLVWQILANNEIVAEYCTKERAMEVLDEIQKLVNQNTMCIVSDSVVDYNDCLEIKNLIKAHGVVGLNTDAKIEYISPNSVVYEMPKE